MRVQPPFLASPAAWGDGGPPAMGTTSRAPPVPSGFGNGTCSVQNAEQVPGREPALRVQRPFLEREFAFGLQIFGPFFLKSL